MKWNDDISYRTDEYNFALLVYSFANCELRSMVIVDRGWASYLQNLQSSLCRRFSFFFGQTEDSALSFRFCRMIGSDESSTNYPGKIPHGLDLPSDVADEKHAAGNGPAK